MFRRYLWQFLGAVLALGAIFSTYDVYMRSRPVKELQVTLNSVIPLVSDKPLTTENIQTFTSMQLIFNNKVVTNAMLFSVTVKNTGNQPIVESDYSKPLVFSFMPKDEIVELAIIQSIPANIGMNINKTSNYQAAVEPVLLNPEDTVTINFIVAIPDNLSLKERLQIGGRIVGVKEIKLVTPPKSFVASLDLKNKALFSILGVLAGIFSSLAYERLLGVIKKTARVTFERIRR